MNPTTRFIAAATACLLAACGDADGLGSAETSAPATSVAAATSGLFDADGQPSAKARTRPAALPVATQSGLYATEAELAWETLTVEPYTVLVDLDTAESPASAVQKALANQRASADYRGVAHFVRGATPADAAAAADALTAAGVERVFLVTGRAR